MRDKIVLLKKIIMPMKIMQHKSDEKLLPILNFLSKNIASGYNKKDKAYAKTNGATK